eukprot:jgi/Bigna1/134888/aug1.27_g9596
MVVGILTVIYLLIGYSYARFPDKPHNFVNDKDFLSQIGVIIPCHKSEKEIAKTIRSILVHLPPENIAVVDNSNDESPPDETQKVVREENAKIQYLYVPHGLKTRAMWEGMKLLPPNVKYIVHIDDDTILPRDMVFDEAHFSDEAVSGVSYGISMVNREIEEGKEPDPEPNLVQLLVDREFLLFSQWRYFRSLSSNAWFCHGIIGLWRRDRFQKIMEDHPFLPFGEDGWIGAMNLLQGYRLKQELRCYVSTFAPSRMFREINCSGGREQGYGASNLWKQRAHRWYVNAPRRMIIRTYLFLTYDAGGFAENVFFRVELLRHMSAVMLHVLAPVLLAKGLLNGYFLFFLEVRLGFYLIELIQQVVINYILWRHRPDIQQSLLVVFVYPFYTDFLQFASVFGAYKCLLYYYPWVNMRMGIFTVEPSKLTVNSLLSLSKFRSVLIDDDDANFWRVVYILMLALHGLVIAQSCVAMPWISVFDSMLLGIGIYSIKTKNQYQLWQLLFYAYWTAFGAAFTFFVWYVVSRDHYAASVYILPDWAAPVSHWTYTPGSLLWYNYYFCVIASPFVRTFSSIAAIMLFRSLRQWIECGSREKVNAAGYCKLSAGGAEGKEKQGEENDGSKSSSDVKCNMSIGLRGEEEEDLECDVHDPEQETPWAAMT